MASRRQARECRPTSSRRRAARTCARSRTRWPTRRWRRPSITCARARPRRRPSQRRRRTVARGGRRVGCPPIGERDFTWLDGERLIRFGRGALADAPALLGAHGLELYTLLTNQRALAQAPSLAQGAEAVVYVPAGRVDEVSAELRLRV